MENKLTERQEKILAVVVKEYVKTAQPVSSKLLEEKHNFGLSPATLRNEMQKLSDAGYLSQPHTSAGRVPTDKGYRFFVNELLDKEKSPSLEVSNWEGDEQDDTLKFIQNLTKRLAEETRALAISYLADEDIFWKEGWEGILRQPEFEERENVLDFANLLKNLEDSMTDFKEGTGLNIYIGGENKFPKAKNFTVISSHYKLPSGEEGVISILGPKRMAYDKNLSLINSLMKMLESF